MTSTHREAARLRASVRVLRAVGLTEAVSFLLLLGVAMPLKYGAGLPQAVQVMGMAHGLLFLALLACIFLAWTCGMSGKLAAEAVVAAIVPTGPFWIDGRLRRLIRRLT